VKVGWRVSFLGRWRNWQRIPSRGKVAGSSPVRPCLRGNEMLERVTSLMHCMVTVLDWIVAGAVVVVVVSIAVTM